MGVIFKMNILQKNNIMSNRNILRSRAGNTSEYVAQTGKGLKLTMKTMLDSDPANDPQRLGIMLGPIRNIGENIGSVNNIEMGDTAIVFPDEAISTTYLFKDVVVEFRSNAGDVKVRGRGENKFESAYLVSYVSIGIPSKRFDWLRTNISAGKQKVSYANFVENQGYHWVTAKMVQDVTIDMYDPNDNVIVSYGSACEVMQGIQQSIVALVGANVRLKKTYKEGDKKPNAFELSVVVSSIQMYDVTQTSSPPLISTSSLDVMALKPSAALLQIMSQQDIEEEEEEVEEEVPATAIPSTSGQTTLV